MAREALLRRVEELAARRKEQETKLDRLEKVRGQARDKAELLSEKYEDVKDRGQELSHRVETVLSKLQVGLFIEQILFLVYEILKCAFSGKPWS